MFKAGSSSSFVTIEDEFAEQIDAGSTPADVSMIFESAIRDPISGYVTSFDPTAGLTESDMVAAQEICTNIETARRQADFVYALFLGQETPLLTFWYNILARTTLRQLRVPPPQFTQNSVAIEFCRLLYQVDNVGCLDTLPKEYALSSPEDHQAVGFSYATALTLLLNFVYNDQAPGMPGSGDADRAARVSIAKKAHFFVALHLNLSFTMALFQRTNGVELVDPIGFQKFVLTGLFHPVSKLINGYISSIWLFAAECFSIYMQMIVLNPFAKEFGGFGGMPFYHTSWEKMIAIREEDTKLSSIFHSRHHAQKTNGSSSSASTKSFQDTNDTASSIIRKRKFGIDSIGIHSTDQTSKKQEKEEEEEEEEVYTDSDKYITGYKRYGKTRL